MLRRTDVQEPLRTMGDRRLRSMLRQPELLELLDRFTVASLRTRAQSLGTDAFWDTLAREQYQQRSEVALSLAEAGAVARISTEANMQRRDDAASAERQPRPDDSVIQIALDGILIRPPAVVVSSEQNEAAPLPTVTLPPTPEPTLDDAIAAWAAFYEAQNQ